MMVCLLTCCEALHVKVLGPALSAMSLAGGTVMGACVVAFLSLFPMAETASAGVSMGMGASVVTAD
jgi:hypothetical protein